MCSQNMLTHTFRGSTLHTGYANILQIIAYPNICVKKIRAGKLEHQCQLQHLYFTLGQHVLLGKLQWMLTLTVLQGPENYTHVSAVAVSRPSFMAELSHLHENAPKSRLFSAILWPFSHLALVYSKS